MNNNLSKPTDGPWVVEHPYGEAGVYVSGPATELVAKVWHDNEANARLIAAAPELLACLKMITDLAELYGVGTDCDGNIIEARELIARVEGRAA
jgi:hypothetical protein